jgi:penicillin-insensitive murein DD-endopeptidase
MAETRRSLAVAALLASALPVAAQPAFDWAAVTGPAPGPPRITGGTGLGCIAGAMRLAADGPGWQAVRLGRNRHWGHPTLVATVTELAARATSAGLPALLIGDMAQPRGGPMPYGHASHQTGLDVDIWLDVTPRPALTAALREDPRVPSVVNEAGDGIDPARWRPGHATLIRLAAESAATDRVLVNPAIKRALCRDHAGAPWLRRVRPWWGHDSHLHLRLRCPGGQPECQDIAPPPPGDGCDNTLDWWFTEAARRPAPRPPGPPARLPAACAAILTAD